MQALGIFETTSSAYFGSVGQVALSAALDQVVAEFTVAMRGGGNGGGTPSLGDIFDNLPAQPAGPSYQQQQAAIGRGPAEAEWRAYLEALGVELEPKANGSIKGPDAVRTGGTNLGWNFAELKPNNPKQVDEGFKQIQKRFGQGYDAPGALYTWEGSPGNFLFKGPTIVAPQEGLDGL